MGVSLRTRGAGIDSAAVSAERKRRLMAYRRNRSRWAFFSCDGAESIGTQNQTALPKRRQLVPIAAENARLCATASLAQRSSMD